MQIFFKYQSLENDFIIFDWFKELPEFAKKIDFNGSEWKKYVLFLCDRHIGIGANGVLIIINTPNNNTPEMLIFNSDGTNGQSCINGLRCVVKHLYDHHQFSKNFQIQIGKQIVQCSIDATNTITLNVGKIVYKHEQSITTEIGIFTGHNVTITNPHFIIFDKKSVDWLQQYGKLIESNQAFPNRTNVECIAPINNNFHYEVTVYERGCGVTRACSSGAAAIMGLLIHLKLTPINQKITLTMPGGVLFGFVDPHLNIILTAQAESVFTGSIQMNSTKKVF